MIDKLSNMPNLTKRIGEIAKRDPYLARAIEISFYGALLSFMSYLMDALTIGDFTDLRNELVAFLVAVTSGVLSAINERLRERAEELEKE